MTKDRIVGYTARGNRTGETHHNAKLTDHEVNLIRDLYEQGLATQKELAEKFEISYSTCFRIVKYQKRAVRVESWLRIKKLNSPKT